MRRYFRRRRGVCRSTKQRQVRPRVSRPDVLTRLAKVDRSSLLVSTALASTLLVGSLLAPTSAAAQTTTCSGGPAPGPTPIVEASATPIICVNADDRTSNGSSPDAINLSTTGVGSYIDLYNSGLLTASGDGIGTRTADDNSFITIDNWGDINSARGIFAQTSGSANDSHSNAGVEVHNQGDLVSDGTSNAGAIYVATLGSANGDHSNAGIEIDNAGELTAERAGIVAGTFGDAYGASSSAGIDIDNAGDIDAGVYGIYTVTQGDATGPGSNTGIDIDNSGDISSTGGVGILAITRGDAFGTSSNTGIEIENWGDIDTRANGIGAGTFGSAVGNFSNAGVAIHNAGDINSAAGGIVAEASGNAAGAHSDSGIDIENWGDIDAFRYGIAAATGGDATGAYSNAGIDIDNWGDIVVAYGAGIFAYTSGSATGDHSNTGITIDNEGDIESGDFGIRAETHGMNARVEIDNDGDITAALNDPTDPPSGADGIYAFTGGGNSPIRIDNEGDITVYGSFVPLPPPDQNYSAGIYDGIYAVTVGPTGADVPTSSPIHVVNMGDITTAYGEAIDIRTYRDTAPYTIPPDMEVPDDLKVGPANSPVTVINHGTIYSDDDGIEICTAGLRDTNCRGGGGNSPVMLVNYGEIDAAYVPLDAVTYGPDSPITFHNYGDVVGGEEGLDAETSGDGSFISITNKANVEAEGDGISAATSAYAQGDESPITVFNTGDLYSGEVGIYASTGQNYESDRSPVSIFNSGEVIAGFHGIYAHTDGADSPIYINNGGKIIGGQGEFSGVGMCAISDEEPFDVAGICAVTEGDDSDITIVNYGSVSAVSGLAIDTDGGATTIDNKGLVKGRVDLTEADDVFYNSGTFEARQTSDFGENEEEEDDDRFYNTGLVHAQGQTSLINLEQFNNSGLISMIDGRPDDELLIEGPVAFNALSGSKLAVDAKLGPTGSKSDLFAIDGDVDGKTAVVVNNINSGAGAFNKGIPVVEVTGSTNRNDFFLKGGPIETGFFTYDLFFEPGDPNVFELRSAPGRNAFVLPQLTTAMQDLWHATSDTWFDRTADLRVALYGAYGAPGVALQPEPFKLGPSEAYPAPGGQKAYPRLWARGSFGELNRDDSVTTRFGKANLNRDQRGGDFQAGIDFGTRDLIAPGDALILGVLGGFVVSELDYDQLAQSFDLTGGQVGAYATYLNGGLFVDTLFKADFVDLEPKNAVGFSGSLDAHNLGVRVDSGFRFGGFTPGMFFEPLATIGVVDSEIDNFTQGTNKVRFDDGTSVRGRLGLRVGTSFQTAQTIIEPFVIGSVWHEFEDDNRAALVSSGSVFNLTDGLEGTWGEVSAGVNVFNVGGGVSGFGKIDVAFGDDIDGVGGRLGVRVKW